MKRRLTLAILLMFTILGIGIVVAVLFQRQASADLRRLVKLYQIEDKRQDLELVLQRAQQDLLLSGTAFASNLDGVIDNVHRLDRAIEICSNCHHSRANRQLLDTTAGMISDYKRNWSRFITSAGDEHFRLRLQREVSSEGDELLSLVRNMRQMSTAHLDLTNQEVMRSVDRTSLALLATLLTTGLGGFLAALVMARRATQAFGSLVDAVHGISAGQKGAIVEHHEDGEIGELIDAFNRMSMTLLQNDERVRRRNEQLRQTRDIALITLARLAESRDTETGHHLERIAAYSLRLAKQIQTGPYASQVDDMFLAQIHRSSPLHDIGKVGIADSILLKKEPLTPAESAIMRTHAGIGGDTLRSVTAQFEAHEFLNMAIEIAYSHHENWDGSGYPVGLSGEAIPLSARIVGLADAYDAITSARPYKRASSHNEAIHRIVADSGTHFDPVVVEAFLACELDFLRIRVDSWHGTVPCEPTGHLEGDLPGKEPPDVIRPVRLEADVA